MPSCTRTRPARPGTWCSAIRVRRISRWRSSAARSKALCGFDWASLKSQRPDWIRDKIVNVLIQDAHRAERGARQARRPAHHEIRDQRRPTGRSSSSSSASRCSTAPSSRRLEPPPDRLAILRKAFDETMADPQFLADADKDAHRRRAAVRRHACRRSCAISMPRRRCGRVGAQGDQSVRQQNH